MTGMQRHPSVFLAVFTAILLWTGIALSASAPSLEDLSYLTEEYYPFNYTEERVLKGLSTDLLRMVWDETGTPHQTIQSMPWARAYESIQHDAFTVLFSMARTQEREEMFAWAGPILVVRFVLIAKKKKGIMLNTLDDLGGFRVGTVRDDVSDTLLAQYKKIATIEAVADMEQNISKLMDDRLDMVAYEARSWDKIADRLNLAPQEYEVVYVLNETPIYYAFHKGLPVELIRTFQEALDRIRAKPAYQQLLDRYLN